MRNGRRAALANKGFGVYVEKIEENVEEAELNRNDDSIKWPSRAKIEIQDRSSAY